MSAIKGQAKPEYTYDEKLQIVQQVCDIYESQNCTIASACESVGISDRTFLLWRTQNADFADIYKKAKTNARANYWENIIQPLAETALQRLLKGEEFTEKRTKGERVAVKNPDGTSTTELMVTEQVVTEKRILPNASVVIFVNKGLYPETFVDHTMIEQNVTVSGDKWFTDLPIEKQAAIIEILNAGGNDSSADQTEPETND